MSHKHRILIVDDDEDILDLLRYNFFKEGYHVKTLSDSADAIAVASQFHPDLVILDLMMSPYNGIDICRMLRQSERFKNVYIFFLTAKSDDYYQHAVFNVGGDEFVEKIVGLKPLLSKVTSVLKENFVIKKRLMKLKVGGLELYRGVETVYNMGNKIILSKPEFEILFFMVQNAGKRISVSQLIQILWGSKTFMDELSVKKFIESVRRKLGQDIIVEKRMDLFLFKGHK
jgi:two-component system, OmpR family, alkaline phosphatase synthesis response regulator PhoP